MAEQSFGASYRSMSDQLLRRTLAIGLGGSALLHTAAIAGASYFYQGNIDDLEITEIERVKVDPEPVAKPFTPAVKPRPIPEPKVFKPKTIAAQPIPILSDVPKLKPIDIPPEEVVKITKAAPTQPQTSPRVKPTAPAPAPNKIATFTPPKSTPPPSFPNKLFSDPQPKPARTKIAAQTSPKQEPPATNNQAALAPPSNRSPKLAPAPTANSEDNSDPDRESSPSSPGSTSKVARTPDRSPIANNQTNLNPQSKSPPGFNSDFGATDPSSLPSSDDFAGAPGNNTRLANNVPTTAPANNNQVGLGSAPQRGGIGANFGGGGDNPSGAEEAVSGAPGNNSRIARSNGGGKEGGSQGNQTALGGGNRRSPSLGSEIGGGGNNSGNGSGNSGDDFGGGTPGNVATGSRNPATIQCLRNCEIRYPDELENSDIGKDKILVKVTIDPNGLVASAEIARSSGNQKLDRVTLAGVKQMQLNSTGKTRTHRIKISTLLNN
jgi:TonB family protein